MKKFYYNFKIRSPWPLTLSLGLLFAITGLICYMNKISYGFLVFLSLCFLYFFYNIIINIFIIIYFCFINFIFFINYFSYVFLISMVIIISVLSGIGFSNGNYIWSMFLKKRYYTDLHDVNKYSRRAYNNHPQTHIVYKCKKINDLIVLHTSYTHSEITGGIQNEFINIDLNLRNVYLVKKVKVIALSNNNEKNDYINYIKENKIDKDVGLFNNHLNIDKNSYQILKDWGYDIEETPVVNFEASKEVLINTLSNINLGKSLIDLIKN